MKIFLVILLLTFYYSVTAQAVRPAHADQLPMTATCYWAYSVRCVSTAEDSLHHYSIAVSLALVDRAGAPKGSLPITNAKIYCIVTQGKKRQRIKCLSDGVDWVAKFSIRTNQVVPVIIATQYNRQKHRMTLQLNEGAYPGERNL